MAKLIRFNLNKMEESAADRSEVKFSLQVDLMESKFLSFKDARQTELLYALFVKCAKYLKSCLKYLTTSNLLPSSPSVLEATVARTRTPAAGSSTSSTSAPSPGPSTGSSSRPATRPSGALGAADSRSATMATARGAARHPRAPHCPSCTW